MANQLTKTENKQTVMQMILGKASKLDMIRTFGQLTLPSIISEKYPSVGSLKRQHGIETTEKVISVMLFDLSSSFNGALDENMVSEICVEISSSTLNCLSLEDIYLCCRNIKTSDSFGKLSLNKVMKYMNKHLEERSKLIEESNYNNHLANKFSDQSIKRVSDEDKEKYHEAQVQYLIDKATKKKKR